MPGEQDTLLVFDIPGSEAAANTLIALIEKVDEKMKGVSGINISGKTGNAATARQQTAELAAGLQQIAEMQKKLIDLETQLGEAKKRSRTPKSQTDEDIRARIEASEAVKKQYGAIRDKIKWDEAEVDSMVRKRIELKQIKAEYIKLGPEKQAMESGQAMITQMKELSDELLKLESSYGQFGRNVGNYAKAMKPLEEEFQKVSAAMAAMQQKAEQGLKNAGARQPVGFSNEQWKQQNTTMVAGAGGQMVAVLNEDTAAFGKAAQQGGYLNTILQKNEMGFTSVTQGIRFNERALVSLKQAGLGATEAFAMLREETVESAREMKEFQRQQKLLESELPALKGLTIAAKALAGAYAIGAGASALFADGNEKVEKEMNKLIAIMTILQGLNEAWELVNEAGAVIAAERGAATGVLTVATEAYTFVTEGATAATIALNAALVTLGIGAIIGILAGIIILLQNTSSEMITEAENQKKVNDAWKEYNEELVKASENLGKVLEEGTKDLENQIKISEILARTIADEEKIHGMKMKAAQENHENARTEIADLLLTKKELESLSKEQQEGLSRNRVDIMANRYDIIRGKITQLKDAQIGFTQASNKEGWLTGLMSKIGPMFNFHTIHAQDFLNVTKAQIEALESEANAMKPALERGQHLVETIDNSTQAEKERAAMDAVYARELYERKVKALNDITNILREQQAEYLELQQLDTVGNLSTRLTAAAAEKAIREQIIVSNRDMELRNQKLTEEERIKIIMQADQEIFKLDVEFIDREVNIRHAANEALIADINFTVAELSEKQRQYYAQQETMAQQHSANQKAAAETDRDQRLKALDEEHMRRNPNGTAKDELQKYNDAKLAIETEANDKILRSQEELVRKQLALATQHGEELKRKPVNSPEEAKKQMQDLQANEEDKNTLTAKYYNLEYQRERNAFNQTEKLGAERLARKKMLAEQEIQLGKEVEETVAAFVRGSYQAEIQRIEKQIQKNNELKETEAARIQNSTLQESAKAAQMEILQRQTSDRNLVLQRKENEARRKEAEFERDKAVLDVIANTAIAITKSVADFPLTGGMPWAAIAAGIGAAQLTAILAKPIPKFKEGTESSPEGLALLHAGEMRIDPSGKISMTPDVPESLAYLQRGTKIIPRHKHDEMNDILLGSILNGSAPAPVDNRLFEEVRGMKEAIVQVGRDQVQAIRRQKAPETHVHVDSSFLTYIKNCQ